MNRKTLLALMVWAIDRDLLEIPVLRAWEMFQRDAWGCYKTYTDPSDELLYCPNLIGQNPLDVFTDYTLSDAKSAVVSGIRHYGKYDTFILNYKSN